VEERKQNWCSVFSIQFSDRRGKPLRHVATKSGEGKIIEGKIIGEEPSVAFAQAGLARMSDFDV
jgi:hypothetical protein